MDCIRKATRWRSFKRWGDGDPEVAAAAKFSLVHNEVRFQELLEGVRERVGSEMKIVVERFPFALWPQLQHHSGPPIERQHLDSHRDRIYEDVVAAFQWGIDCLCMSWISPWYRMFLRQFRFLYQLCFTQVMTIRGAGMAF